jgi:hypothetical protein
MIKQIIHKIVDQPLLLLNYPIYHSQWFKNLFVAEDGELYPNNKWYREHDERNFDLVVLGSSSAKWGFDFNSFEIKAMNWAQAPQTLIEDYNILRNFHSILRKGGFVVITIMPFTCLNKQTGIYDALKYLKISTHKPIEPHLLSKAQRCFKYPILLGKQAIKAGIHYLLQREQYQSYNNFQLTTNPMTEEQLIHNAQCFIEGWKKQFDISDFNAPLSSENMSNRRFRVKLMQTIIDFCLEREYVPIFVIPPTTNYLAKYINKFEENYIYSYINEINRNIPLYDYSKSIEFHDDDLFFNSFFLNKKGRTLLTKRLLTDLNLINNVQ